MQRLPTVTGEFRLTREPELRFTAAGKAVASLSVIASERVKDQQTNEWRDGDKSPFLNVSVWDKDAEAIAEAGLVQGERVLVTGQLFQREYDKADGSKGTSLELKFATVAAIPGGKPRGAQAGGGVAYGQPQNRQPAKADPWAQPSPAKADPWGTGTPTDPPF